MDESKLAYDRSVTALTGAGRDFELTRCSIDNVDYTVYKNAPKNTARGLFRSCRPRRK